MKKFNLIIITISLLVLGLIRIISPVKTMADWWERPAARPTSPAIIRDGLPTEVPPTSQPTQNPPTPTTASGIGGLPSATPTQKPSGTTGGSSSEDPCASGKSFTGPYCGWSPSVGSGNSNSGGGVSEGQLRIGGPKVLGLSNTGSDDLKVSDIIALTGVLCLLLYVRSKLSPMTLQ